MSPAWSATILPKSPSWTASTAADAEPGGQHPVEGRRRPATLDVAEDGGPGLVAGPPLDLARPATRRCLRAGRGRTGRVPADGALAALARRVPSGSSRGAPPRPPPRSRRTGRLSGGPAVGAQTASRSKGTSGTRISAAPPAMPAWAAIRPTWRPITSHTMTRWCDSAVVRRRSIASVAICTAVSNPNVTSVPERSLSMVFGHPHHRDAERRRAGRRRPGCRRHRWPPGRRCPARAGWPGPAPGPRRWRTGWSASEPRMVPPRVRMPRHSSADRAGRCRPR